MPHPAHPQISAGVWGAEAWGGRWVISVQAAQWDTSLSVSQKSHLTLGYRLKLLFKPDPAPSRAET